MPYKLTKLKGGKYRLRSKGKVIAKRTTKKKALKQIRAREFFKRHPKVKRK